MHLDTHLHFQNHIHLYQIHIYYFLGYIFLATLSFLDIVRFHIHNQNNPHNLLHLHSLQIHHKDQDLPSKHSLVLLNTFLQNYNYMDLFPHTN